MRYLRLQRTMLKRRGQKDERGEGGETKRESRTELNDALQTVDDEGREISSEPIDNSVKRTRRS